MNPRSTSPCWSRAMISRVPVDHRAPGILGVSLMVMSVAGAGSSRTMPFSKSPMAAGAWVRLAKAKARRGRRMPTKARSPSRICRPAAMTISSRSVYSAMRNDLVVKKQEVVPPGRPGESSGCQVITPPGQEAWMNVHKNARLTLRRRQELVRRLEAGAPLKGQARRMEISVRTARKWWGRYRTEGSAGLLDRSSRPHDSPARTAAPLQLAAKVLRWQHWTGAQIASALGISAATARRILRRSGRNRRGRLELPPVVTRYEHAAVGDLLHLDIKKLGRITYLGHRAMGQRHGQRHGARWERVHVAVDDRSRVAYVELLPDEHSDTARGFVRRALAWFRARGVRVRRGP